MSHFEIGNGLGFEKKYFYVNVTTVYLSTMMPSHKIKNAVFDLRFRSKSALLQENASLGGFVKKSLMPVVDEVLSENALEDHVIYLDKLEIDLGSFQPIDFKHRMESQLREKLDTLLRSKIRNLPTASDARERIVPLTKRNLELIEHFLMTGTLPGPLSPKQDWIPDRQLQLILKQERSAFLRFLQETAHRPHVIQRLVRQFPTGTVRQVARLLAPTQSKKAFKAVNDILHRYQYHPSNGMQTTAFTALVWELILDYLLQNPDNRFTAARFHHWISRKAERLSNPAQESLMATLTRTALGQQPRKNLVIQPVYPPKTISSKKEARKIFKGYDLYEALKFYLKHGAIQWSAGILAPAISITKIIDEICASYPEKLLKLANDLRYEPDRCQRLAEKLTPARMKQFITALVSVNTPGNDTDRSTFIQSIIEYSDHAPDRTGYYADVLHNLVTRRPIDLKQIAARSHKSKKAMSHDVSLESGQDPDLIRAKLTAMLNTGSKTDVHDHAFSRLLDDLENQYPFEYRDYLMWLAADKKRFTSFLKLLTVQDLNKTLAYLAGYPSLENRAIEALEALPAGDDKRAVKKSRLAEPFAQSQSNRSALPGEWNPENESALISYLTGGHSSHRISDITARVFFKQMIRHGSDSLYASVRDHLKNKAAVKKLITLLPENWLTRVLAGLQPGPHQSVQTYADIISDACYSKKLFDRPEKINTLKWEFIFTYLGQYDNRQFQESDFIRCYISFLADKAREGNKTIFAPILSRNLASNSQLATRAAHLTVIQELNRMAKIPPPHGSEGEMVPHHSGCDLESEPKERLNIEHPAGLRETAENIVEAITVANAGMVIAAPYLPRLWEMLDLIERDKFKGFQEAERAVNLLQFMTDESTDSSEYQLVLNKLLCGIKLSEPVTGRIDISAKEREAVESLIRGMIENWKTIGHTSVGGFRESFFQRRGGLTLKEDAWHLMVEQRAFDMLLDSIPWGFATIKHSWMEKPIYVKWR